MDFILFFIGFCALVANNRALTLTIIVILTSTYLQLPVKSEFWDNFLFPHNVSDLGLGLYIIFFIKAINSGYFNYRTPLTKATIFLLGFLIVNGIYDILKGTSVMDVIAFLKLKLLITIVFISKMFDRKTVIKAYRYIFYTTLIFCIFQIANRILGLSLLELNEVDDDRGAKPVFSVMLFSLIPFANLFNQRLNKRILYGVLIILPIIMNMKMTYAGTVLLSIAIFLMIDHKITKRQKIKYAGIMGIAAVCVFAFGGGFTARLNEMTNEKIDVNATSSEGNFSYRILHAYERFYYISRNAEYSVRGIGYVAEKNFKKEPFVFGQYSQRLNKIAQLDTGDIVWSIFFLRYGFLGIGIYLYYYFSLIKQYRLWKSQSVWKYYWISILITFLMFTSIGNTIIGEYYFFIFPILFIMIRYNENSPRDILIQCGR